MRKSIFMYLFFFALLWVVFQYVYQKNFFESQDRKIKKLEEKVESLTQASTENIDSIEPFYFSLAGNESAYTYFENSGIDITGLEEKIETAVIAKNGTAGNVLVPFVSDDSKYNINKVAVLNHKWIIADFSDGQRWGELLLQYDITPTGEIQLETLRSTIYPN